MPSKPGRPPNYNFTTKWNLTIPAELAGQVEIFLFDPLTSKPRYGGKSELVTQLLHRWLEEQKGNATPRNHKGESLF